MRAPDWQSKFAAFVKAKQAQQFAWGQNDCCLFVCDAICELTGRDPGEDFRGRYDSFASGAKLVKATIGAVDTEKLIEHIAEKYGLLEIGVAYAQRGDVGLLRDEISGDTMGLCIGSRFAFLMEDGLTYRDTRSVSRAWRAL